MQRKDEARLHRAEIKAALSIAGVGSCSPA
jgi:hypothetical protein